MSLESGSHTECYPAHDSMRFPRFLKLPASSSDRLSEAIWVAGVVSLDEVEGGSSFFFFTSLDFF